jgi:hypothetical protein
MIDVCNQVKNTYALLAAIETLFYKRIDGLINMFI